MTNLRNGNSNPVSLDFMLFSFSSSSSSCTCSSFSNVLTLSVAIFSRSLLVCWLLLTHRFLAPPECSLGGPEPPPRSQTSMLLGTGCLGYLYFASWFSLPTLPRWSIWVEKWSPSHKPHKHRNSN